MLKNNYYTLIGVINDDIWNKLPEHIKQPETL